jgi:hypothetical protein
VPEGVLCPGFPVSFRGKASAMARMAADSAVRSAFAVEDRRSLYHRGRGGSGS